MNLQVFRNQKNHSSSVLFNSIFLFILVFFYHSVLFAQTGGGFVQSEDRLIKVELDSSRPSIVRYVLKKNNTIVSGNINNVSPTISF